MDFLHISMKVLLAAKVDVLISKNPEMGPQIRYLEGRDPTPQKKYLEFGVKALKEGLSKEDAAEAIERFHKDGKRLDQKDINRWDPYDLVEALDGIGKSKRKTREEIKLSGGEKVYEDDQCIVVFPKDHATACFYGKSTQWCVTMDDGLEFDRYRRTGVVLFFVLRKGAEERDNLAKVAAAVHRPSGKPEEIFWYGSKDPDGMPIPQGTALSGLNSASEIVSSIKARASKEAVPLTAKVLQGEVPFEDVPEDQVTLTLLMDALSDNKVSVPQSVIRRFWEADRSDKALATVIAGYSGSPEDLLVEIFGILSSDPEYAHNAKKVLGNPGLSEDVKRSLQKRTASSVDLLRVSRRVAGMRA